MRAWLTSPRVFGSFAVVCLLLNALIQSITYLNPDCAWLLELARRVLEGDRLYADVSETNPPLIVWMNLLPAALSAQIGLPLQTSLIICVSLLTLACAFLCYQKNKAYPALTAFYLLLVTLLSAQNFAQREHLLLMLALPYLISLLPGNRPSCFAATIAALGFLLKPHFLLILFFIALWRSISTRSARQFFEVHYWIIALIGIAYALFLVTINTDYWHLAVPMLVRLYSAFDAPLAGLARDTLVFGGIFLIPYVLALFDRTQAKTDPAIRQSMHAWFAASMGALLVVWLQQRGWLNHWFLYLGFAFLLNGHIVVAYARHQQHFRQKLIFAFAALALCIRLCIAAQAVYHMTRHEFPETTHSMVSLLHQQQRTTSMTLSFDLSALYPASFHAGLHMVGTYAHLWFLPGYVMPRVAAHGEQPQLIAPDAMDDTERALFDQVVNDLVTQQPDLVLVTERSDYFHPQHRGYAFDFVRYYGQDARFNAAWQHYRSIGKAGDERVYRRISPQGAPENSALQKAPASE